MEKTIIRQPVPEMKAMYREWRKANRNRKPNRAIVKVHWEDDGVQTIHTIGLENMNRLKFVDNPIILWYSSSLANLIELTKPGNGSDFVLDEVLEFYKS